MRRWLSLLGLLLIAGQANAVDEADLLPVDQAFAISAKATGPETVRLTWTIADGYYLYRHRFAFESTTPGVTLGEASLPDGNKHTDEFFGEVETYRGSVHADIPVHGAAPGETVEIRARIQGCADVGVCYPPHYQTVQAVLAPTESPDDMPGGPAPSGADESGETEPLGQAATGVIGTSNPLGGTQELNGGALPADEAFRFEAIALAPDQIGVRFTVAPGYYLYREQFDFELENAGGAALGGWTLPPGEAKTDEHFGDVRVFHHLLEFPLPLKRTKAASHTVTLVGHFQGCKEAGICYPPMERRVQVELPKADPASLAAAEIVSAPAGPATGPAPVSEQDRLAGTLLTGSLASALAIFFAAGLLLAFTPCIFPMVPILAGILAGEGERLTTRRAFGLSLVYVLAMALTYTAAGVIAGVFGQNLQAVFQQPWILVAFSLVFVALALSMFGFYELQLPSSWQTRLTALSNRQRGGTWAGVAIMGLLSALIVGPCVAPPLTAALIVIGQQGDPVLGGAALFALSLGMGAPLLIIGASAGRLLPRAGAWMTAVKRVFGVGLLALAIWILERILPGVITMLLWAALLIVTGVYLGALDRLPEGTSGWRRLWKGLGVLMIVAGAIELVGAAAGGSNWMQPLRGLALSGQGVETRGLSFEPVNNVDALDKALADANGKPVMLDFYADWCVECKRMENYTYTDPDVARALSGALLLKADVTKNDGADQALLKRFGLIGPPAVLFFSPDGRELTGYRVVGYMGADEFTRHVRRAFAAGPEG